MKIKESSSSEHDQENPYEELFLSNQLCFLVYQLDRKIQALYRPLLDSLNITYPQYLVLLVLWEQRRATIGELCRLLHLDTGTISPLIRRLQQHGLVTKQRSQEDERSVLVELTEKGKQLKEQARSIPSYVASCLLHDIQEYQELRNTFQELLNRLG
ncbi:MAG TPA: MarR family transcriptional regulator [Termitinemataceae bacterium]|nr:MarR family transcriptional regulator [Termitinemataceae bacterium]HOM22331.1 MarR family transcriptional regulator [Termitinemataceae bacterium]HPP99247.1 MarR family transcriptional regulator [Termitinemataceae bacterium]